MSDLQLGKIIQSRGSPAPPVQGGWCCYHFDYAATPEGPRGGRESQDPVLPLGLPPERTIIAVVPLLH